ncbi:MAG: PBP1A family penicillin-binding protein [Nitrospirae bacterium]|nr:PBP1A family penicillin-binding protein [Nitrospirota bacterium]
MKGKCIVCGLLLLVFLSTIGAFYFLKGLPGVKDIRQGIRENPTRIYASDGVLIGQLSRLRGEYVSLKEMPDVLIKAVIATEDSRFFQHRGVDYLAIIRAFLKDLIYRRFKEGGSTITQQLAKMAFLSNEKTITRKIKELIIALRLERSLSKEEILELYLNRAYFGWGFYGVQSAADGYFGKSVKEINIKEAAVLAGLLKAPEHYSPFRNPELAEKRARVVLKRMEKVGFLKPSERKRAERIKLHITKAPQVDEIYGYYLDAIKQYLIKRYGPMQTFNGGLRVYTTLRRWAQIKAVETLKSELEKLDKLYGWRGPLGHKKGISIQKEFKSILPGDTLKPFVGQKSRALVLRVYPDRAICKVKGAYGVLKKKDALWARRIYRSGRRELIKSFNLKEILKPGDIVLVKIKDVKAETAYLRLEQIPRIQGAIVSIRPQDGYVQALVGGYSYRLSQFNRALRAKRQAGSVFKPFIYALALTKGFSPDSIVYDTPVEYKTRDGSVWRPMNYDRRFHGKVTLAEALKDSLNVATIKIAESVGVDEIASLASKAGFTEPIPRDLSIALGSLSTSPLQLAAAYTAFAATDGIIRKPLFIKEIRDQHGRVLEKNEAIRAELIQAEIAYVVTQMLVQVVRDGTGRLAGGLADGVAGKTGTTDGFRDAWFVGYTPSMVTVVWVGYDDNRSLGAGMSGGRVAAPIWKHYMRYLIGRGEKITFNRPKNVVKLYKKWKSANSRELEESFRDLLWNKND